MSGSFLNLVIYTMLNDHMKRSIVFAGRLAAHKLRLRKAHPSQAAEPKLSVTKSTYITSQREQRVSRQEQQQQQHLMEPPQQRQRAASVGAAFVTKSD